MSDATPKACDAWVGINGARITCQLLLGHEGLHTRHFDGRTEHESHKDVKRIHADLTWSNTEPVVRLVKSEGVP